MIVFDEAPVAKLAGMTVQLGEALVRLNGRPWSLPRRFNWQKPPHWRMPWAMPWRCTINLRCWQTLFPPMCNMGIWKRYGPWKV